MLFLLLLSSTSFATPKPDAQALCAALLNPHATFATILPDLSDEQALRLLKANYSELITWLAHKTDATAEGANAAQIDSPSQLLFGEDLTEVNRSAVGFLAMKWILANDYEAFTANQVPALKLTPESFSQLRRYVVSVVRTPADIDAMIVMILTNDLGKVRRYHELTERGVGRVIIDHDEVLFTGFSEWPETAPNFMRLLLEQKDWIISGLRMGSDLNIGQYAQGENLPANLAGVKTLIGKPDAFEFKFLELLLDVAGARGHENAKGAAAMIEPVWQSYSVGRRALLEVIAGQPLRKAYDQVLLNTARRVAPELGVENPEQRALLRLLTLRRANAPAQAEQMISVYQALPANGRAILNRELNIDAIGDGWGTLPYYAPALFANALNNLGPERAPEALRSCLLALARVYQESRLNLTKRGGDGVVTVNLEKLAVFARGPDYAADPSALLNQEYRLKGDADQFFVELAPMSHIDAAKFPSLDLANLSGQDFVVAGIGGGSDAVQAAILAQALRAAGKNVRAVLSFRTTKLGSQGVNDAMGATRTFENAEELMPNVFRFNENTTGTGRVLEPLVAEQFPTYVLMLDEVKPVADLLREALPLVGAFDTLLTVDTGGDSLYRAQSSDDQGRATPDQDLRVLEGFAHLATTANRYSVIVAAGVDTPPYAEEILSQADARYLLLEHPEEILRRYEEWEMTGANDERYGKTPLAWQAALNGAKGFAVVPLPERVVLSKSNPWMPFVRIPLPGIFIMRLEDHYRAIN